jgi:hypothetical protein
LDAKAENDMNKQLHESNLLNRYSGSCEWLLSNSEFKHWCADGGDDKQRILWLKGSPGAGKSIACSSAIDHIMQNQNLCLYHFCRFDDQSDSRSRREQASGIRTAALLVDQLFRHFWISDRQIVKHINNYIETVDRDMNSLREVIRIILKHKNGQADEKEPETKSEAIKVFMLLDGPDEDENSVDIKKLKTLFDSLGPDSNISVRLWVSSRDRNTVRQQLGICQIINLDKYSEKDVNSYLTRSIPKLEIEHKIEKKPRRYSQVLTDKGPFHI